MIRKFSIINGGKLEDVATMCFGTILGEPEELHQEYNGFPHHHNRVPSQQVRP